MQTGLSTIKMDKCQGFFSPLLKNFYVFQAMSEMKICPYTLFLWELHFFWQQYAVPRSSTHFPLLLRLLWQKRHQNTHAYSWAVWSINSTHGNIHLHLQLELLICKSKYNVSKDLDEWVFQMQAHSTKDLGILNFKQQLDKSPDYLI